MYCSACQRELQYSIERRNLPMDVVKTKIKRVDDRVMKKAQELRIWLVGSLIILLFIKAERRPGIVALKEEFHKGYTSLGISGVQMAYVGNFESIGSPAQIENQEDFFDEMHRSWMALNPRDMSRADLLDYQIIGYEIGLNKERLILEKKWERNTPLDGSKSICNVPNGKLWYSYLLKRWVDREVTPDELFDFGRSEIDKVKANMRRLQETSGLSKRAFDKHLKTDQFFIEDPQEVQMAFEEVKKRVARQAPKMFPYVDRIPEVAISRGTNPALAHVPAYYSNNTFYYNLFDKPFNRRQLGWFYAHEAIPGHHYQGALNRIVERSEIQELFWYPGFVEGWGAYVEYLGEDLDAYSNMYDEYGKWEWDLIRSVRVCLDIGINYRGWSDDKALAFWNKHIEDQEDIAKREIARMKRWPAQVITYKYGAAALLSLLEKAKEQQDFDFKRFHETILAHGDIPISILLKQHSQL